MAGKQWQQWGKNQNKSQGWDAKGKGKAQQPKERGLPSYDASSSQSSTTSAAKPQASKTKEMDMKAMLQALIEKNDFEIPECIKEYMQPDVGTTLQQDQKELNAKRKLAQRVERLKAAQLRKQDQWDRFKQEIRQHMIKEKQRFETEMAEIQEALKDTQCQLDKAMSGVIINVEETEEKTETDIDMLFANMDKETEQQKDEAEEQTERANAELLRQTQAGHQLLAKQIGEMQAQMTYMAQILMSPAENSPIRQTHAMGTSPTSTTLATPSKRRNALEPFARTGHHNSGPYGATPEKTKAPQDASLETLDGYGPA